jgi:hypothetical protein
MIRYPWCAGATTQAHFSRTGRLDRSCRLSVVLPTTPRRLDDFAQTFKPSLHGGLGFCPHNQIDAFLLHLLWVHVVERSEPHYTAIRAQRVGRCRQPTGRTTRRALPGRPFRAPFKPSLHGGRGFCLHRQVRPCVLYLLWVHVVERGEPHCGQKQCQLSVPLFGALVLRGFPFRRTRAFLVMQARCAQAFPAIGISCNVLSPIASWAPLLRWNIVTLSFDPLEMALQKSRSYTHNRASCAYAHMSRGTGYITKA